jgi:DNA-binding LacI/PurR family transcriptional regulator
LNVPEDIAFGGYDDIPAAHLADSSLTTVHIFTEKMGQEAARRLFSLMQRSPADLWDYVPTRTLLQNDLVVRTSCGCAGNS